MLYFFPIFLSNDIVLFSYSLQQNYMDVALYVN